MKRRGNISYMLFLAVTAAVGGLLFGYDTAVIFGTVELVTARVGLDSRQQGWYVGCALAGSIAGVLCAGVLSDRLGRRRTMLVSAVLFTVSAAGCALCADFTLVVYRIVGGLGTASFRSSRRFTSPRCRRRAVGACWCRFTSWPSRWDFWRPIRSITCCSAWDRPPVSKRRGCSGSSSMKCGGACWEPKPFRRWFSSSSSSLFPKVRAGWRCADIRTAPCVCSAASTATGRKPPPNLRPSKRPSAAGRPRSGGSCCRKASGRRCRRCGDRHSRGQFMGVNAVLYYGPSIFERAGWSGSDSLFAQILVGAVNMLTTVLALAIIDRVGRKKLVYWGCVGYGAVAAAYRDLFPDR